MPIIDILQGKINVGVFNQGKKPEGKINLRVLFTTTQLPQLSGFFRYKTYLRKEQKKLK
jgi:hypothetical protein